MQPQRLFAYVIGAALALGHIGFPSHAKAQDYPSRPVKIIINVSVGGVFDTFVRVLAEALQKRWGHPVVVEPRPGGNFIIAGQACAASEPDGYTLCALTGETLVQAPLLYKQAKYQSEQAFVPISQLFYSTQVYVAHSKLNVKDMRDVESVAKKSPQGFAGLTLSNRLFINRFNKRNGTDVVFVPMRGGSDVLNSVVTGSATIAVSAASTFAPFVEQGIVVPIAVDGAARLTMFPNVPTLIEVGYPEKLARNYLGLVAPKGTPQPIVARVYETISAICDELKFKQRNLLERGLEPVVSSPNEFAAFLKEDISNFEALMKEGGVTAQ